MTVLPVELYRDIVESVDHHPTLHSILFVNRAFSEEAERVIYSTIYQWEADEQLLNHLYDHPRHALLVLAITLSMSSNNGDRLTQVNRTLQQLVNLRSLALFGRWNLDLTVLIQNCTFRLKVFKSNRWHDDILVNHIGPNKLLQSDVLRTLHFAINRTSRERGKSSLEPLASLIRNSPNLIHIEMSGSHRPEYPPLSTLFHNSTTQFRSLHFPKFQPDEGMVHFLMGQKSLRRLGIQTSVEMWPRLASVLRQISTLICIRLYCSDGERVPIDPLLGEESDPLVFNMDFIRLTDYTPDSKTIAAFINRQPSITAIQFPAFVTHRVELPRLQCLYGSTAELFAFKEACETRPRHLYWMEPEFGGGNPTAAEVDALEILLRPLKSFAIPFRIDVDLLFSALQYAKGLHYLGLEGSNLSIEDVRKCLDIEPDLEVFRLSSAERSPLTQEEAESLFGQYPKLRRISSGYLEDSTDYTITYLRSCPERSIRTPEPKSVDVLMGEFKLDRWTSLP